MKKLPKANTARLSEKQREFLEIVELANRPVELEIGQYPSSLPYYIRYDFWWDWGFMYERDARRWIKNLESRGLITVKDNSFAYITDIGRRAIEIK